LDGHLKESVSIDLVENNRYAEVEMVENIDKRINDIFRQLSIFDKPINEAHATNAVLWAKDSLGFDADPWQADVLNSTAQKLLLNCSRQSDKSAISAILALHTAIFWPKSLTLMISPSMRQSGELFRAFLGYLEILEPTPLRDEDTKLSLKLSNGSRVISLPSSEGTIRGYSAVNLLIIDDAARVLDDLYFAVKPMLAISRGRLLALSTPWGKRGWWFDEWENGEDWQKYTIEATKCPRISPQFLEAERKSMPRPVFESEYMCIFSEAEDCVFSYADLMASFSNEVIPLEV
jgi:hypothetical protein